MAIVLTSSRPLSGLMSSSNGPVRQQTVCLRYKVVKRKVHFRPKKTNPSARRHGPCTSYPELPPPPPVYTIVKDAETA